MDHPSDCLGDNIDKAPSNLRIKWDPVSHQTPCNMKPPSTKILAEVSKVVIRALYASCTLLEDVVDDMCLRYSDFRGVAEEEFRRQKSLLPDRNSDDSETPIDFLSIAEQIERKAPNYDAGLKRLLAMSDNAASRCIQRISARQGLADLATRAQILESDLMGMLNERSETPGHISLAHSPDTGISSANPSRKRPRRSILTSTNLPAAFTPAVASMHRRSVAEKTRISFSQSLAQLKMTPVLATAASIFRNEISTLRDELLGQNRHSSSRVLRLPSLPSGRRLSCTRLSSEPEDSMIGLGAGCLDDDGRQKEDFLEESDATPADSSVDEEDDREDVWEDTEEEAAIKNSGLDDDRQFVIESTPQPNLEDRAAKNDRMGDLIVSPTSDDEYEEEPDVSEEHTEDEVGEEAEEANRLREVSRPTSGESDDLLTARESSDSPAAGKQQRARSAINATPPPLAKRPKSPRTDRILAMKENAEKENIKKAPSGEVTPIAQPSKNFSLFKSPLIRIQEKLGIGSAAKKIASDNLTTAGKNESNPSLEPGEISMPCGEAISDNHQSRTPHFSANPHETGPDEDGPLRGVHRLLKKLPPRDTTLGEVPDNDELEASISKMPNVPQWARGGVWFKLAESQTHCNPYSLFGCGVRMVTFDAVFRTPDFRRAAHLAASALKSVRHGGGGSSRQPQALMSREGRIRRWDTDKIQCGFSDTELMSQEQLDRMVASLDKTLDLADTAYETQWFPCNSDCSHDRGREQPWFKEIPETEYLKMANEENLAPLSF